MIHAEYQRLLEVKYHVGSGDLADAMYVSARKVAHVTALSTEDAYALLVETLRIAVPSLTVEQMVAKSEALNKALNP